jgi:hypothetical protein
MRLDIPDLSMEIFSAEFVFGPVARVNQHNCSLGSFRRDLHTDRANDGGAAVILFRLKVSIQARGPFQLCLVGQVLKCVRHDRCVKRSRERIQLGRWDLRRGGRIVGCGVVQVDQRLGRTKGSSG